VGQALGERTAVKALLVSDSNVDPLHGAGCAGLLHARGLETVRAVVPAGEGSKSLEWAARLYEQALEAGLDRTAVVVALGGGMVGDLAGFVSATYLRGVRLVQVPTTLLAMVDSSVGGKTGVNLPQGKNLVGVFHQPIEVVADLDRLGTLPEREYLSGLAEVVKYGVIWDASFFGYLEAHADALVQREGAVLERVVARCCEIKAEVVAMDEREQGPRAILNFGHTLGHALEAVDGYGVWLHGEAVAVGMAYAGALSAATHGFACDEFARLTALLQRLGLPVRPRPETAWAEVRRAMAADKKTVAARPRFVLARKLGAVVTRCELTEEQLAEAWNVGR
jgi:3-dehydroquinate synthase